MLYNQIQKIIITTICQNDTTRADYLRRLKEGLLTRDENPSSHFCAYFLPYDNRNKKVFLVHHKKAKSWISPGGHIDRGEVLVDTLNREISEELGLKNFFQQTPKPFLLTITPIDHEIIPCKMHFDIWFPMPTNGDNFEVDKQEFYDTRWFTLPEAKKIVTDPANKKALDIIENNHKLY